MKVEKDTTALLVMDFQNDIVHEKGKFASWGIPTHVKEQGAIENTKKLLEKARSSGFKIIFVKVEYEEGYPEVVNAKAPIYAGIPQSGALIKNTWGAEIHENLKPLPEEIIISKSRINPFTNKDLKDKLDGIKTLILTGVATNFVVEATARTAAALDYEIIIPEDCCASMNQQLHEFSMKNILPNFATISNVEKICEDL